MPFETDAWGLDVVVSDLDGRIGVGRAACARASPAGLPCGCRPGANAAPATTTATTARIVDDRRVTLRVFAPQAQAVRLSAGDMAGIGPVAGMPVMEGKALLFRLLAGINGYPILIGSKDPEVLIQTVRAIAPTFGAIKLEDIASPECFEIEERLQKLKLWREKKSRELAIEPGILANNALLEALAGADTGAPGEQDLLGFMKHWQQEVFGAELLQLHRIR